MTSVINADYLHKILLSISLVHRDAFWTNGNQYEGAWQLFIRDFDPSLSVKLLNDPRANELFTNADYSLEFLENFESADQDIVQWANSGSMILDCSKDSIVIKDKNGLEWVKLSQYHTESVEESGEKDAYFDRVNQTVWNNSFACFVKEEDSEEMFSKISDSDFRGN